MHGQQCKYNRSQHRMQQHAAIIATNCVGLNLQRGSAKHHRLHEHGALNARGEERTADLSASSSSTGDPTRGPQQTLQGDDACSFPNTTSRCTTRYNFQQGTTAPTKQTLEPDMASDGLPVSQATSAPEVSTLEATPEVQG